MAESTFMGYIHNLIHGLKTEKEKIDQGGGEKAVAKQHAQGKLTARERVVLLLDKGSFEEIDKFVKHRGTYFGLDQKEIPYDGVVTGFGTIEGKKVAVFSQDFTVQAGSLGEMHAKKIIKIQNLAVKYGIPLIGINDSGGARIQEGVDALFGYGGIFLRNTHASGVIPQISIIAGPCAGGAVYSPAITDFIIMVDKTSQMFITGPAVVKAVTHEDIDKQQLGGAMIHNATSGVAHFIARNDKEAVDIARKLLSYIPASNLYKPETKGAGAALYKLDKKIYDIVPDNSKKAFDVRDIIKLTFDKHSFFEIQEYFAKNIIIAFARIGGRPVGIIANQPNFLAGVLDIDASDKAARFIRFCDAFNIPIVSFVDTPGFLPGVGQEHGGVIRHGAKLLYAYAEAAVPMITIILRKSYGGAYIAMASQNYSNHRNCCFSIGIE
jgi:methylmalonyl-CoA decarboxylase subunit alpha